MFKHENKKTDREFQSQQSDINQIASELRKGKDTKIVFENYSDTKRLILEFGKFGNLINIKEENK